MKNMRIVAIAGIWLMFAASDQAAEVRHLTLDEAVHLAIEQNHALKIARLKVAQNEQKKAQERSGYFPAITNQSNILHVTDLQSIGIPAGTLGTAGGSLVPARSVNLPQGQKTFYSSGTMLAQPVTQLIRIRQANRMAAAETAASKNDLRKVENDVALEVHSLFFNILIARLQKQAAAQQSAFAEQKLRESQEDVRNGSALNVAAIQGQAGLLESRQTELTADLQLSDLSAELNDVLGLPVDTELDLDAAVPASFDVKLREEYVNAAMSENPEIASAEEAVRKARAGVKSAKTAYIPDITAYARESYQDGVPFLSRNFGTFGISLNYDVFDFGKRRAVVREREDQLAQAEENVKRLKDKVEVDIEKSYNKLLRTKSLVQVANQVVKLRQESERLTQNQLTHGVALASDRQQTSAATYKAQADYLQATLGYLLAWAELQQTVGRTPGL